MKTISISCVLPANAAQIWSRLLRVDTLKYIAAPYAVFSSVTPNTVDWRVGATSDFKLRVFGVIPMGAHTIHIKALDEREGVIQSVEHNKRVSVWNHKIMLTPLGDSQTRYTDEVEIGAGNLTPVVVLWAKAFYRHRQRRWGKICG